MPIPWLEIPSPTLGNTKKTCDDCYGQTTAQRIKKKIYSILEQRQDEIRVLKYLEPRQEDNLPGQQICYPESQITDNSFIQEDGCLKRLAEIITWDLIRLLDYFHSSTTLTINGFKAYPELRVDQLSICYSREDITQTHIFILVDNYKGDCSSDVCLKRLAEIIHSHLIRLLNQPNRSISLPFNGFRDIDNSLTNPVCADIPHVIEKIKSGRNIKDIDDSLADPGADHSPHGKEETSDERNKKDIDDNLKVPVADDLPHGKEETSDERNKQDIDDNLKVPVADDPPHGKEETSDERNKQDNHNTKSKRILLRKKIKH